MKTDLSKFQLSKTSMNSILGGNSQACHCGGSNQQVIITSDQDVSYEDMENVMDERCEDHGWACHPL